MYKYSCCFYLLSFALTKMLKQSIIGLFRSIIVEKKFFLFHLKLNLWKKLLFFFLFFSEVMLAFWCRDYIHFILTFFVSFEIKLMKKIAFFFFCILLQCWWRFAVSIIYIVYCPFLFPCYICDIKEKGIFFYIFLFCYLFPKSFEFWLGGKQIRRESTDGRRRDLIDFSSLVQNTCVIVYV